ncbi:hypothetical protein TSTA_101870 [Talaromyces stipitatus ATCC 10500]|uniref:Uncharacterized protein n=1 Tax=Talaromyces stipitatus (strain ATCC 10500 / CBS 375.48 / QM 6759 / NRRL 1006) TaxID=441959 RepID=B8MN02_TALSN|nr:uncharacterized protein TSTA_101870 [Talaromyces stipitatus ATCC 10500]EED13951.1 hypothetical protein TSTA_101870 [Talaromyces stipitatus ATCC 10500]
MEEDPAVTTRVGRVVVPSTRAREALEGADSTDATTATRRTTSKVKPTAVRKAANQIEERQCAQDENQMILRKMCQYLEGIYREVKILKETLRTKRHDQETTGLNRSNLKLSCRRLQATPGAARYHRESQGIRLGPLGPPVPPTIANILFCTIDTSHVREEDKAKAQIANVRQMIKKEIQGNEGMET